MNCLFPVDERVPPDVHHTTRGKLPATTKGAENVTNLEFPPVVPAEIVIVEVASTAAPV
jgi:hypothetical protein